MPKLKALRMPLPTGNFRDASWLVQHASDQIDHIFAKQEEINPMWIACSDVARFVIGVPLDDKAAVMSALRAFFKKAKIRSFVSMHEAWALDRTMNGGIDPYEMAIIQDTGVKDHPDRREIVALYAEDGTKTVMGQRFILRPEHGKPKLSPLSFPWGEASDSKELGGRMTGMLPTR